MSRSRSRAGACMFFQAETPNPASFANFAPQHTKAMSSLNAPAQQGRSLARIVVRAGLSSYTLIAGKATPGAAVHGPIVRDELRTV